MALLKQNTGYTRMFLITSTSDHIAGLTGQTPVITLYKSSTSSASSTGTVAEATNGLYKWSMTSNDANTIGDLAVNITSTAGDPVTFIDQVVGFDPSDSVRLGLTALPNAAAAASGGLWILGSNNTAAITLGSITSTSLNVGSVTSTGTWTIPSITSTGTVSIINLTSTGTVSVNNLTSTGTFTIPNITSTGTVSVINLTSTGTVSLAALTSTGVFTIPTITSTGSWSVTGGITANITGNLSGSVGSVTGAVGSVTAAVTVGTNNDKTNYTIAVGGIPSGGNAAAELNNIADAFLDRNMAAGVDSGTNSTGVRTPRQSLRILRNKTSMALTGTSTQAGTITVTKEDDATTSWTGAFTLAPNDALTSVDPS